MIPDVGTTAKFTFTAKFATLNGIYKVRAQTTFEDALASGIDFIGHLYTPAGLQLADFNTDYSSYLKDKIAVLESVVDSSIVYYTPESIFQLIPDPTINEYYSLIMVVDLGVQQNTQAVYPLIDQIKDMVQSSLGTTNPVTIVSNSQNKVYLTNADYDAVVAARQANIQTLIPLNVQIIEQQNKLAFLAAKCAAYEALLTQLATTPTQSS